MMVPGHYKGQVIQILQYYPANKTDQEREHRQQMLRENAANAREEYLPNRLRTADKPLHHEQQWVFYSKLYFTMNSLEHL